MTIPAKDYSTTAWPPVAQPYAAGQCTYPLTWTRTFNVWPGQAYTELTNIPWLSLQAGDVVNIYHRAKPYRTKFWIRWVWTAAQPIIINGVTDANCNLPEINWSWAVTATDAIAANPYPEIQHLGLILIYKNPSDPDTTYKVDHITIQNLKLTWANRDNSFYNYQNTLQSYVNFTSAIYAVRVWHLTLQNNIITNNGIWLFTNSRWKTAVDFSENIIIRNNRIYFNGNPGSATEHNIYSQARRVLIEWNYLWYAYGWCTIKDRSSATVIRYNYIQSSGRAIDLVEDEEEYNDIVRVDPLYQSAWLYGNIIVNDLSSPVAQSANPIHWGYDNTPFRSRTWILNFYNNTFHVIDSNWYKTSFFQLPWGIPTLNVYLKSNIITNTTEFWKSETVQLFLLADSGSAIFWWKNLIPKKGIYSVNGPSSIPIASTSYAPDPSEKEIIDAGTNTFYYTWSLPISLWNLQVDQEFQYPYWIKKKIMYGSGYDLWAVEYGSINTGSTVVY
jgi:hypothetical protein